jgi:putative acetyltransferase
MELGIFPISEGDNKELAKVIRYSLELLDYAIDGTVYTDPKTDQMYAQYQEIGSAYWVLKDEKGEVWGGCGIKTLPNGDPSIAELQRMFIHPNYRGKGYSNLLMVTCIDFAKNVGFKQIYLETLPRMDSALALYSKHGFKKIPRGLGDTGHFSCDVFMLKEL